MYGGGRFTVSFVFFPSSVSWEVWLFMFPLYSLHFACILRIFLVPFLIPMFPSSVSLVFVSFPKWGKLSLFFCTGVYGFRLTVKLAFYPLCPYIFLLSLIVSFCGSPTSIPISFFFSNVRTWIALSMFAGRKSLPIRRLLPTLPLPQVVYRTGRGAVLPLLSLSYCSFPFILYSIVFLFSSCCLFVLFRFHCANFLSHFQSL